VENSNRINLLFATGHSIKDAAAVLGITQPTLRKHYFSELEQWRIARLKLKARHLEHLHREGEAGNVTAIKELFKQMDRGELAAASEAFTKAPKKAKPPKLGKKAELEAAAREGSRSGEWGQLLN
jgi:hypothetical protein